MTMTRHISEDTRQEENGYSISYVGEGSGCVTINNTENSEPNSDVVWNSLRTNAFGKGKNTSLFPSAVGKTEQNMNALAKERPECKSKR